MDIKDKTLIVGLVYKIVLDLVIVVGLLGLSLDFFKSFLLLNVIIKMLIDGIAIRRILEYNKKKESE